MKVRIQAEYQLYATIKRKGDWYVAICPPLDLATQGKTLAEAKNNIKEASQMFLESCIERGTLEQAFRELGLVTGRKRTNPPSNAYHFKVPIPFTLRKKLA